MAQQLFKAIILGAWAALSLPLGTAGAEDSALGGARFDVPDLWTLTDQRGEAAVSFLGPQGEGLYVSWWFPDEPLLGYADELSHETRSFPAGPALVIRSQFVGRAVVSVVFERENAAGERLSFNIESETVPPEALEATLDPILQQLRFDGDPEPAPPQTDAPQISTPQIGIEAPSFDALLAALSPLYGADCTPAAPDSLPATAVLSALSLTPDAAGFCAGQSVAILSLSLPQDPRQGQAGLLGMIYLRGFLAQGKTPLVLLDTAHAAMVTVTAADGSGIAVAVADLPAPQTPAPQTPAPAEPPAEAPTQTQLFSGVMTEAWLPHSVRGGKFDDWARIESGALRVDVPAQPDFGTTGLKSAEPVLTLPAASDPESLHLRFDLDPATTTNAVFALVPSEQLGKLDWDAAEIWLAIEQKRDADPQLVLAVQRQLQARHTITDRAALTGLTLTLRPDGMILLTNAADQVLLEGVMADRPKATALHLQVSATSPGQKVPAHLDLRAITLDRTAFEPNDPGALLADAPQTTLLFDGRLFGPHFKIHGNPRGADYATRIKVDAGLQVTSAQKDGLNGLGIYTPEPVVWLDRFGKGASVRLRFEFDPARTDGFRLGLGSTFTYPDADPGFPRFVLDWRRLADGTIKAARWTDREEDRLDVTPAAMPAVVELVLTPDGVQVLAEGFPSETLPWGALREGQGFRLYALARAETAADPVSMVLNRITLTRTPQSESPLEPAPLPGVAALPVQPLFPNSVTPWEPYGLAGVSFEESGRFNNDGSVTVDVAAKYEGGRAGVLSAKPVAVLDDRLNTTPYRLTLTFDPDRTDGLQVMLSNSKTADMWKGSEASLQLVRQTEGRAAGSAVLTLTKDYYAYWTRTLTPQDMARWDGTLLLDLAPGTLTVTLPDVVTHRGNSFNGVAKGAALFMTVQSLSDTKYGAARMALRSVTGQWQTPRMMSARDRLLLVDTADFDADAYLDLLAAGLSEDLPQ